jgi:hypothetical protein
MPSPTLAVAPVPLNPRSDTHLVNVGQELNSGPVALVVSTPGFGDAAYVPLVEAIESEGIDAWLLSFPVEHQQPDHIIERAIPGAVHELAQAGRTVGLVGHGLGGTLAAAAATRGDTVRGPDAIALLGAPLQLVPSALTGWMLHHPIPPGGLNLNDQQEILWEEQPALELLLGEPLPHLERVSSDWLHALSDWLMTGRTFSLDGLACPAWVGASGLDNLAPPESVRPFAGPATFERFGLQHFDPHVPDHADLLRDEHSTRVLARWLKRVL